MSSFFAKLKLTGAKEENVLLTFKDVKTADEWWEIIEDTDWQDLPLKKDNVNRPGPQSFTMPNGKDGAASLMTAIQSNEAMKAVNSDVTWKVYSAADEPAIPEQDAEGNTIGTSAMEKRIADLEARLKAAEAKSATSTAVAVPSPKDLPLTSTTGGANWRGSSRFQGGPQHYEMATDAFKMALECKDRGDNRDFQMIFSQIFMEQRRTVGVRGKKELDGYKSRELIASIYSKAKELQDRGDDRPFGLIFGDLSMAFRRGTVMW